MALPARRLYGVGLSVLGVGNVTYGAGQLATGGQLAVLSLVQVVMGVTLVLLGGLVVVGSDRLAPSNLSERALLAIGAVGTLVGAYLLLASAVLFL